MSVSEARSASRLAGMLAGLLLGSFTLASVPPGPTLNAGAALGELVEVGGGELRWLGMVVYEARLLNGTDRFDGDFSIAPLALEITYRRNISRDRLVRTTGQEWNRLARELGLPGHQRVQGWLEQVAAIWPDVTPGDRIIALVQPTGVTEFHNNDGLLGEVSDPQFGPAFLGIWLHPATRAADLRAALLGADQ